MRSFAALRMTEKNKIWIGNKDYMELLLGIEREMEKSAISDDLQRHSSGKGNRLAFFRMVVNFSWDIWTIKVAGYTRATGFAYPLTSFIENTERRNVCF